MSDIVDRANDLAEMHLATALSNRPSYQGVSALVCVECDTEIPELRRKLVPGVKLCVDCQQLVE
jgi:phage/conjugal plasmid C-4 type zinc finger TraR family protein